MWLHQGSSTKIPGRSNFRTEGIVRSYYRNTDPPSSHARTMSESPVCKNKPYAVAGVFRDVTGGSEANRSAHGCWVLLLELRKRALKLGFMTTIRPSASLSHTTVRSSSLVEPTGSLPETAGEPRVPLIPLPHRKDSFDILCIMTSPPARDCSSLHSLPCVPPSRMVQNSALNHSSRTSQNDASCERSSQGTRELL